MTQYFGPECSRKEGEIQIAPPLGQPCIFCTEAIGPLDMGTIDRTGHISHYECLMRSVIGSVGHQLGRCSCFGGKEEDSPGLTPRQAAQAALMLWISRQ